MAGNSRSTGLEQFYTPGTAALELTKFLLEIGVDSNCEWIEPAAGTASFVNAMHELGIQNVTAYDIDPRHELVAQADFLAQPVTAKVCLTNPPFGRNNSLSVPFFNRLALSCDVIAFIVPRSWRKWSVVNRLDRNFVKIVDRDLELSYVDAAGNRLSTSTALNTVFQVWVRSGVHRDVAPKVTPVALFEVVKPAVAKATITQFGRGCGTVRNSFDRVPNTTQMFIDAPPEIIDEIASMDLSPFYTQTAYIEALSRIEINYAVQESLAGRLIAHDFLVTSNLVTHASYRVPVSQATGVFTFAAAADSALETN